MWIFSRLVLTRLTVISLGQGNYDLEFKTGDQEGAGTDAKVFVQLYGEEGQTEVVEVGGRGNFKRGHSDRFRIHAQDVGRVSVVNVCFIFTTVADRLIHNYYNVNT